MAETSPPSSPQTLYTTGYEGRDLDAYLRTLAAAGVTLLCQVF